MQNKFIGKLTDPVHLLVWRDTWSKAYVIQEEPPLRGTDEAKEAFMDRWQEAVDARINFKHPQVKPCGKRIKNKKTYLGYFFPGLHPPTSRVELQQDI